MPLAAAGHSSSLSSGRGRLSVRRQRQQQPGRPLDRDEYQTYASIRRHLALPEHGLQSISSRAGRQYGLHPSVPELHRLYESRRLAIIANVGRTSQRPTHFDPDLHYLPDGYAVPSWVARWVGVDRLSGDGGVVTGFPAAHRPGHANALSMVSVTGDTGVSRPVAETRSSRFRTTFPASAGSAPLCRGID